MQIKVDNFSGPLDLLLKLIEKEEMDITAIALFEVAEQYMEYLKNIEENRPNYLADFLLVATKLIYLKSRALLPPEDCDEDSIDSVELERQLQIYKIFQEKSEQMAIILEENNFCFGREDYIIPKNIERDNTIPSSLNALLLQKYFLSFLKKEEQKIKKIPIKILERTVSIKDKISRIRDHFSSGESILYFSSLIDTINRQEVVVSFLGMLELVKQKEISVKQDEMFGDIVVEAYK